MIYSYFVFLFFINFILILPTFFNILLSLFQNKMKSIIILITGVMWAQLVSPALIYIPEIPVNPMTLYQLQVACNILEADLNYDPRLPFKYANYYYNDVYLANYFLQQVANDPGIVNYNNILYGQNNGVVGNKNIIFGNTNTVYGSQNYVFSQNFDSSLISNTAISNNLVLDNWLIDLYRMYLIPFNPKLSLSQWM